MRISDWSSDVCSSDLTVEHLDLIADFIVDADFGLRTRCGLFLAVENARGFGFADRLRLAHRAEEARALGRILAAVLAIIRHRQLGEDLTGEEFAFGLNLPNSAHPTVGKECARPCRSPWPPHH